MPGQNVRGRAQEKAVSAGGCCLGPRWEGPGRGGKRPIRFQDCVDHNQKGATGRTVERLALFLSMMEEILGEGE